MTTKQPHTDIEEKSLANKVIDLIIDDCELVHTEQNEPYAIVNTDGVRKVYSLTSKNFVDWVLSKYYAAKKSALSEASLKNVISTLSGKAVYEGNLVKVHTRIAKTDDGYWLDLCNDRWEAVLVSYRGWEVMSGDSIPLFRRSSSMQAIPTPIRGSNLDEFWGLVNIPEKDRLMVVAWLLECLRDDTPHVVLEFVGEQGSAKSTTQKLLKMLIDPNIANLRAAPKKVEDVWIGAFNSHLISYENISHLGHDYQDALCVMATGGAHATRTLYTNREETIIELRKPIVLNGITVNVTAQDLLDRSIHIELPPVKTRLQSRDVEAAFSKAYPKIVGALLDRFVDALTILGLVSIEEKDKPRMLDFAYLGEAVYQSNGLDDGVFTANYKLMRQRGIHRTIESSPVGLALLAFLKINTDGWSGQLQQLLWYLNEFKPAGENNWPKSPKGLGDAIRRLTPALRMLGFECKASQKTKGEIIWEIRPILVEDKNGGLSCPASPESPESDFE